MSKKPVIQNIEKQHLKKGVPPFRVGDTVRVHTRIIEGNKERIQVFAGTVIARKGSGLSETFSIHRVAYGEGMERVFLLHSPRIAEIEVVRHGDVRRSKLYYLRGTQGKKAKVKSLVGGRALRQNNGNQELNQEDEVPTEQEEGVAVNGTPTEEKTGSTDSENIPEAEIAQEPEKADA